MNDPMKLLLGLILMCAPSLALAQTLAPKEAGYDVGEPIEIDFSGGPGNSTDWVGIYQTGNTPDGDPPSIDWLYTNGTQTPGGALTAGTLTFPAGTLSAGTYALWFLANDGYEAIVGPVDLTITEDTPEVAWVTPEFRRRHAVSGVAYAGTITAYASDPAFTFSKVSGPEWLTVSPTGELGGTPAEGDTGFNTFVLSASDGIDEREATLRIPVCAPGAEVIPEIKVMSYNAWHGWSQMIDGPRKGIESLILSDADLIGMQESNGGEGYQAQRIAQALGWHYRPGTSGSLGIISRYPLRDASLQAGPGLGAIITLTGDPLREVILMNCHLDYQHYGPYAAQLGGATEESVLAEERASQRDEQIASLMDGMAALLAKADQVPVFLTGDFNAPSHLDWTPATAGTHGGVGNVAWPTSTRVIADGMVDSFRELHPDPAEVPGNTWSPIFKDGEAQDRIDFVYFKGEALTPIASQVFTTEVEETVGSWGSSTEATRNNTWPSDHAAVVTTFKLAPVDADEDGLSDAFEERHFGDLSRQAGTGDADGDGVRNADEELFATDPNDARSAPGLSLTIEDGPSLEFTFAEAAFSRGLACVRSADLQSWQVVWRYRDDPFLQAEVLTAVATNPGEWAAKIEDQDSEEAAPVMFYRLLQGSGTESP